MHTSSNQTRITANKTAQYRDQKLKDQQYICPLCSELITPDKAVADHCHRTHRHRAILHRCCNSILGKIENGYKRFGLTSSQLQSMSPIVFEYITKDYSHNPFHHSLRLKPKVKPKLKHKPKVKHKPKLAEFAR